MPKHTHAVGSENEEVMNRTYIPCKLKVQQLTRNVTTEHLKDIFEEWGEVEDAKIAMDEKVHLSLGFGTVEYKQARSAFHAIRYMNGGQIDGKVVTVKLYTEPHSPSSKLSHGSATVSGTGKSPNKQPSPKAIKQLSVYA